MEFKPTIGELPAFDLPNVLPNLPGIADINWDFSNAQTSTIAPSKMSQKPPKPLDKSVSKRKSLVKVKDETVRSEISTQVPTPPVIQNSQKDSTEKKRSTSNLSASMIPPPAPAAPVPPPPPAPKIADSSQVKKVVKIDNDRASLLESIRNPSIKLKKVTVDREMRKKPLASDQEIKASTPGDIMDLLREKLRQRQKFISGK